jgi:hypothetical protein
VAGVLCVVKGQGGVFRLGLLCLLPAIYREKQVKAIRLAVKILLSILQPEVQSVSRDPQYVLIVISNPPMIDTLRKCGYCLC